VRSQEPKHDAVQKLQVKLFIKAQMTLPRHTFILRLSKRYPPRKAAPGPYKVVAQLPERDGQLQYRIKSGYEPFYRTVAENELEPDVGAPVNTCRIPV
jgi:hypothetical protein